MISKCILVKHEKHAEGVLPLSLPCSQTSSPAEL